MIKQIENFSKKSFKNYSTPSNFFKLNNIIFGYNGRGKSSLSEGIVELSIDQDSNSDSLRFFNNDYVNRSLLLEEGSSAIKGVKVSFSENDANIADQIEEKKKNLVDTSKVESVINLDRENLRAKIDEIHQIKKGDANINRKGAKLTIEEVLDKYDADLIESLKISESKEYVRNFTPDNLKLEGEKKLIEKLIIPNFSIEKIEQKDQIKLAKIMKESYSVDDDIPTSEIIKWLENGINLHDNNDVNCKFCNGTLNLQIVRERVNLYKEDSKQKDISFLEKIRAILDGNIKIINEETELKNNLGLLGFESNDIDSIFEIKSFQKIKVIRNQIDNKITNMEKKYQLRT